MGGSGTIIIRNAMKQALSDPLVHGVLPNHLQEEIDPILSKDTNAWTVSDDQVASSIFHWAAVHC